MIRSLVTVPRVRNILAGIRTEADAAMELRAHRIRHQYSTDGGYLHIRIPARSGVITVTRTAARSAPLLVTAAPARPAPYPYPVPGWSWDD